MKTNFLLSSEYWTSWERTLLTANDLRNKRKSLHLDNFMLSFFLFEFIPLAINKNPLLRVSF